MSDESPATPDALPEWRLRIRSVTFPVIRWYVGLSESTQTLVITLGSLSAFVAIVVIVIVLVSYFQLIITALITLVVALCLLLVIRISHRKRKAARLARLEAETAKERQEVIDISNKIEQRAEYLNTIANGPLSPLNNSGELLIRNSEALWFRCLAVVVDRKKIGHRGNVYVTSLRIVFICPDCPFEIPIGSVNAATTNGNAVQIIAKTASGSVTLFCADSELLAVYIARSVKAYNRQIDVGFETDSNYRIPQDVKTVVWQRDGGKCVQCGAMDYLEYDHIIPRAKGGANTVDNVQLLCRRCNLKKSDAI